MDLSKELFEVLSQLMGEIKGSDEESKEKLLECWDLIKQLELEMLREEDRETLTVFKLRHRELEKEYGYSKEELYET